MYHPVTATNEPDQTKLNGSNTYPDDPYAMAYMNAYERLALGPFWYIICDHLNDICKARSNHTPAWLLKQSFPSPWGFQKEFICEKHQAFRIQAQQRAKTFYTALNKHDRLHYKACIAFSIYDDLNKRIHIAQQIIPLAFDTAGNITASLMTFTDISHLKNDDVSSLSFIALNGGEHQLKVLQKEARDQNQMQLSRREFQILALLLEGRNSENIAETLHISIFTVKNHRKKLLSKSGCHSTTEMLSKCRAHGWLY